MYCIYLFCKVDLPPGKIPSINNDQRLIYHRWALLLIYALICHDFNGSNFISLEYLTIYILFGNALLSNLFLKQYIAINVHFKELSQVCLRFFKARARNIEIGSVLRFRLRKIPQKAAVQLYTIDIRIVSHNPNLLQTKICKTISWRISLIEIFDSIHRITIILVSVTIRGKGGIFGAARVNPNPQGYWNKRAKKRF
jgi:hypothetical protein